MTTPTNPSSSDGNLYLAVDCVTNWACVAAGYAQFGSGGARPSCPSRPWPRSPAAVTASWPPTAGSSTTARRPVLGLHGGPTPQRPDRRHGHDARRRRLLPGGRRRRGLQLRLGPVLRLGGLVAPQRSRSSAWRSPPTAGATGSWPPTAASSATATPSSTAPWAASRSTSRSSAWRSTPNGNGYYEVASDGGIFTFPTGQRGPPFLGSTGSIALNKPVVGMAMTTGRPVLPGRLRRRHLQLPRRTPGSAVLRLDGVDRAQQAGDRHDADRRGRGLLPGGGRRRHLQLPEGPTGPPFYGSRGGQPLNAPIVGISG